jgi:capsular exopolysaccharide synthesis family protein
MMDDFLELRMVVIAILRRWWIVALGALLVGALGYFVSSRQQPVYRATTSLFVGRPIQSAQLNRFDIENSLQLARIYADIVRRQPVLEQTVQELGLDASWPDLRNRVRAQVSKDTQLLDISVEAGSPAEAQQIADEIARQLILISPNGAHDADREQAQQFTRQQLDRLQQRIEEGQARLEALDAALLEQPFNADTTKLQDEVLTLENIISRWEANYAQLLAFIDEEKPPNNLAVLEPAQAGDAPVRPKVFLNTLIAAIVGMALAVGFIFLLQFLDNAIRTPDEINRILGLRTLGAITPIKSRNRQGALVVNHDPFSPALEDYRLLRARVQSLFADGAGHTIMVTSAERNEGKSLTAANLGIVMAQAGLKTIIVDANLRQPVMHQLFQLSDKDGLTYLLRGQDQDVANYLSSTMAPNLQVLVSGSLPSNPSELLGSPRMHYLLDQLAHRADIVICDSPEAVSVADALVLSSQVDGVLVVVDAGSTNRNTASQAVANLHDAGAALIGAVLNRVPSKRRVTVLSGTSNVMPSMPQQNDALHRGGGSFTPMETVGD